MKRIFAGLLLLFLLTPAAVARAESLISVSHTMTGYSMGADSAVLNYTITVKNAGDTELSDVTLSYVPLIVISPDTLTLDVGPLGPQAEVQVPFTLTTPMLQDQKDFLQWPLFWAGTYLDDVGNGVEFPACSVEGGAL